MDADYRCRGLVRLVLGVMLLVFGGALVAFYLMPALATGSVLAGVHRMFVTFPLGLMFGGMAGVGLAGLTYSITTFRLDTSGIDKRSWRGTTVHISWRELAQVASPQGGRIALTDEHGTRISLPPRDITYRNNSGRDLYEAVAAQLTTIPETLKRQIDEPSTFRFGLDSGAAAAGFMAVLCVALAITMPFMPYSGPPAPLAYSIGLPAFFLLGSAYMVHLALKQATRVITVTDTDLIDRSIFGTSQIAFNQAVSVTSKDVAGKSGTIEWTTVKSAEATIKFPSVLPDYDRLVRSIRMHVNPHLSESSR